MGELNTEQLEGFYAADRKIMSMIYHTHVGRVERAVSRYCRGVDAENVIHDLFLSLMEKPELRRQFRGGELGAWLATLGSRRAIDHLRRNRRWTILDDPRSLEGELAPVEIEGSLLHEDQIRRLRAALARFKAEDLPGLGPRLGRIFALRFEEGLSQTEAARRLGIPRTTLIDREQKLLRRLGRHLGRSFGGGGR